MVPRSKLMLGLESPRLGHSTQPGRRCRCPHHGHLQLRPDDKFDVDGAHHPSLEQLGHPPTESHCVLPSCTVAAVVLQLSAPIRAVCSYTRQGSELRPAWQPCHGGTVGCVNVMCCVVVGTTRPMRRASQHLPMALRGLGGHLLLPPAHTLVARLQPIMLLCVRLKLA